MHEREIANGRQIMTASRQIKDEVWFFGRHSIDGYAGTLHHADRKSAISRRPSLAF
jgi:hypothetical protein